MNPSPERTGAAPTTDVERIFALDVLRGIAVLGILLMNITGFGLSRAYTNPTNAGGAEGADLAVWAMNSMFFEGTMRGLFTLLFGAGVVLYTSRLERAGVGLVSADYYFRRNIWLVIFGLANAYLLLWVGDILFYYGMTGLFLYVFRGLAVRKLLAFAIPLLCVSTVFGTYDYLQFRHVAAEAQAVQALQAQVPSQALSADQQAKLDAYKDIREDWQAVPEKQAKRVAKMRAGYFQAQAVVAKSAFGAETADFARFGFWECLGMMLLGMALMKSGALTAQWPVAAYWRMLAIGWGIGYTVNYFETMAQVRSHFSLESLMVPAEVSYDLGRIPLTLGHLAFIMLLLKSGLFRGAFRRLAAAGQMALTNYLTQSLVCLFVFTGAGFGLFGQLQRHQLYYVVLAIWVVQLAWSPVWLRHYRFGPLEWAWRSLTRWHRQPFVRSAAGAAVPEPGV
jgi:uncharacterized protein